ncbi:MAG: hypothetical protein QGH15_12480 [Kiritimatiellia bacterium]|jgi:tRNA(Phe) wybutosine-synthesizing methylase Tyw3|nr:hypothetical protein [Kiritimatiellia bacterium]
MSDLNTHVKVSKERTGKGYSALHKWIDEPRKWLRQSHRIERHAHSEEYEKSIRRRFGNLGVVEWLIHIALDNLETANKILKVTTGKAHERLVIQFKKGKIDHCASE